MQEVPKSWLIGLLTLGMLILAILQIDSWTHAILGSIIGYLLGSHMQDIKLLEGTAAGSPP